MTRPPISKLRKDVLRAAMNMYRAEAATHYEHGSKQVNRYWSSIRKWRKACALLAERKKGKK